MTKPVKDFFGKEEKKKKAAAMDKAVDAVKKAMPEVTAAQVKAALDEPVKKVRVKKEKSSVDVLSQKITLPKDPRQALNLVCSMAN